MGDLNRDVPTRPCWKCGETRWGIRKLVNQAGKTMYPYVCEACGLQTQRYVSHSEAKRLGQEPEHINARFPRPQCEVCKTEGAELHHWAPYAIFGDEASRWPTSYLCPACHDRWHRLVGPAAAPGGGAGA